MTCRLVQRWWSQTPTRTVRPQPVHALLDDLLAGPEPELESLGAAEALRELRVDAET
jgi:hypothetical protein